MSRRRIPRPIPIWVKNRMRVLGIDPGLATMGYGVVEESGKGLKLVQAGAVITTPDMTMPRRLLSIYQDTRALLDTYRPDEIVFEELFFAKNTTTGIAVGEARGCALCACAEYGKPLFEYTPKQIKAAITGYGHAEKRQVQEMVRMILGLEKIIRPDDAADAVAAAVIHLQSGRLREQFIMK